MDNRTTAVNVFKIFLFPQTSSTWGVYLYSFFCSHKYLAEHDDQSDNSGKMKLLNMKIFKSTLKDP